MFKFTLIDALTVTEHSTTIIQYVCCWNAENANTYIIAKAESCSQFVCCTPIMGMVGATNSRFSNMVVPKELETTGFIQCKVNSYHHKHLR